MTVNPAGPAFDPGSSNPEAIREALSLQDRALFDRQYRAALEEAKSSFHLEGVLAVLAQWRQFLIVSTSPGQAEGLRTALRYADGEELPTVPVDWAALG